MQVGAATLLAWNEEVARAALHLYQAIAKVQLLELGGYLAEATVSCFFRVVDFLSFKVCFYPDNPPKCLRLW